MIFFLSIVLSLSRAQQELEPFSRLLLEKFEHQSRAALVEEELTNIRSQLKIRQESAITILQETRNHLEQLFSTRISALRKLTAAAEDGAKGYIHDTPDVEFHEPLDEASCEKELARINDSDVRLAQEERDDVSGVHITVESYRCDPKVRRDFGWTGSDIVEKAMKNNKKENPEMKHQFIGTYSGLTRMYPKRRWEIEPAQITVDLFDPVFRPWFVSAETEPKDIVFLMDYSGSVKGPTMHLMKITMMYILSTLNPSDYFYGVHFSSNFASILDCHNNTFLPATTVNKRLFFERLSEIEEKDQARIRAPFNFSLNVLRNNLESNSSLFTYARSNGRKILMIFTDGLDDWDTDMLNEEIQIRGNDPIQIFGFSMGYGTGPLPLLQWLSCSTFGSSSVVDSIMDVKPQSRVFLDNLNQLKGRRLMNVPVEKRSVSWTNLYMEAQGLGPTVTISMPILPRKGREIIWTGQGLAGVAGIDIGLDELTKTFPAGEQTYVYLVDRNGILLYHPKLVLPKTEIHCVRRSACYDSSQVKSKAGAGLRVQYGFSDQRVYRLVGLIDSIPTIDMFEIEGTSDALSELRSQVINNNCSGQLIIDTDREYICSSLADTPYSVVVVNSHLIQTVEAADYQPDLTVSLNPHVGNFLSRRQICNWRLDRIEKDLRFAAMQGLTGCEEELSTIRILVSAVSKWADSWMTSDLRNMSCEEMQYPPGFEPRNFVGSFVHTRAQVTTYFPQCAGATMKPVTAKFDAERLTRNDVSQLQMSVRNDLVFAYKSIADEYGNRLGVVGTQWRMEYIDGLFKNWINGSSLWNSRCKKKDCILVTRSGFAVASNTRRLPAQLAVFDPQLFGALDQHKLVTVSSWVDAQAECAAKKQAPWNNASPGSRSPLRQFLSSIMPLLQKPFWFDLYARLVSSVSAQPQMKNGICSFQKIKPVERCFVKNWFYTMRLNITRQIDINDAKCTRYARVFPVPGTMLTLIEADRSCPGFKPKRLYSTEPQKLEMCEKVNLFPRFQAPPSAENISLSDYSYSTCSGVFSTTTSIVSDPSPLLVIISLFTGLFYL